jgi:hypothetical protein
MDKNKSKNESVSPEDELMYAIGFTPVELAANRDGVLSEYQRKKFRVERRTNVVATIFSLLIAVAIFLFGQARFSAMDGIFLWIPIGFCGIAALFAIVKVDELHRDVTQNRVEAVQGRVSLDITENRYRSAYTIKIQDRMWDVNKHIFLAFKNGDPYVVYYAPYGKKILSAEWLRGD